MKKKGIVTGILFVVLLAFVFQTEIGGFFASVREKAFTAAEESVEETAALPDYEETEKNNKEESEEKTFRKLSWSTSFTSSSSGR